MKDLLSAKYVQKNTKHPSNLGFTKITSTPKTDRMNAVNVKKKFKTTITKWSTPMRSLSNAANAQKTSNQAAN